MDSNSIMLIIILAVLVLLSAFFSATETAFTSFNRMRMKNIAESGNKRAELLLRISEDYDKLLSTILIGNNLVNIAAASLATVIFVNYFGNMGLILSIIVMTLAILIFGEISPKSLVKETPEKFAMFSVVFLRFLMVILTPVNYLFDQWQKLLAKIFKVQGKKGITEEELLTIVQEAEHGGGINEQEGELIRSVLEFNDVEAIDILTPRVDVVAVSTEDSKQEIADLFKKTGYSRLPVYDTSIDNIIGLIHQKDFHNEVASGNDLSAIIKPTIYIAQSMKVSKLLKLLQQSKSHLAVVVDEFGGTVGIVTMEDILEELVGEIWDEHDIVVEEFSRIAENEYRILGSTNLEKMFDYFDIDYESDTDVNTVSGWVIDKFGRIPSEGESFTYGNLVIKVSKTNHRRVQEITLKIEESNENSNSD
ncbi:MAG: HlyC/CorC family transporter [Peptococcaceae bacterium]|nr:HlyC/CorC family transporter [Peptococcaceae bacterium]